MTKLQAVRGMQDWFGTDKLIFNQIVELARQVAYSYDFQEIDTPLLEYSELFQRNLGETSDVVAKEVYTFQDRGDNQLTIRPEFTAGVVRAFIQHPELQQRLPVRLFATGAVFRYDRPQKGRCRQFHQVNFECLGEDSVYGDAEFLLMLSRLLEQVIQIEAVTLEINTLGDVATRQHYTEALVTYLQQYQGELSSDSQRRLVTNPLRILDSKDSHDQELLQNAPMINQYYSEATQERFQQLLTLLERQHLPVPIQVNPELVRGLDYYTSTVFEFTTQQLGAQGTVLAGGRYDQLANQLGYSQPLPAIGAAAGVERLLLLTRLLKPQVAKVGVVLLGEATDSALAVAALRLREQLRNAGQIVRAYQGKNIKKLLSRASEEQIQTLYLLGEDELQQQQVKVKNMLTGVETLLPLQQ